MLTTATWRKRECLSGQVRVRVGRLPHSGDCTFEGDTTLHLPKRVRRSYTRRFQAGLGKTKSQTWEATSRACAPFVGVHPMDRQQLSLPVQEVLRRNFSMVFDPPLPTCRELAAHTTFAYRLACRKLLVFSLRMRFMRTGSASCQGYLELTHVVTRTSQIQFAWRGPRPWTLVGVPTNWNC